MKDAAFAVRAQIPLVMLIASLSALSALPVRAAQLADGTTQFDQPPSLLESGATESHTSRGGMYYFTISVPANAGEPLAGVVVSPKVESHHSDNSSDRDVQFNLNETEAFLGTPKQASTAIALQNVEQLPSNDIRINFAQPVQPGTTLTIGLKPSERPSRSRDYQFGLTAFPVAANPAPVSLGNPTVSFRGSRYRNYPFWWNPDEIFPYYNQSDHRVLFWDLPPEFDPRARQLRRLYQQ
jgi:hypothetical protein